MSCRDAAFVSFAERLNETTKRLSPSLGLNENDRLDDDVSMHRSRSIRYTQSLPHVGTLQLRNVLVSVI